jgi:hypothetical protein
MQWGGNSGGNFLLHSSHSMDCVLCVRILVGSVIIVYSSTGSHYTKQQSASHNLEPFAFRLHILSIIVEIGVFLSSLMYVVEKRVCTAWLMQSERNHDDDDNDDNETAATNRTPSPNKNTCNNCFFSSMIEEWHCFEATLLFTLSYQFAIRLFFLVNATR